jgi:hypothetical protein
MDGLSGSYPLPVDDMGPCDQQYAVFSSHIQGWFVFSVLGILYLTLGWSYGRGTLSCWLECYGSDQLSG